MGVNEADRVIINKVYVGRAALFGLIYGLLMGLLVGIFMAASVMFSNSSVSVPGFAGAGALTIFIGVVILYTLGSVVMFFASALIYNIIALTGIKIHFNLGKYMIVPSVVKVIAKSAGEIKPVAVGKPVTSSFNSGVTVN